MTEVRKAEPAEVLLLEGIKSKFCPELDTYGVTVGLIFVSRKGGPALVHNGYAAAALARISSKRDRRYGAPDCEISVDQETWDRYANDQRSALLHHELLHFQVALDKSGSLLVDANGRPRIKLRRHDFQIGGFYEVSRVWGDSATETLAVQRSLKVCKQLRFEFPPDYDLLDADPADAAVLAGV